LLQLKVIRDTNADFRIDPNPGVSKIVPKLQRIHSFVGMSRFAKFHEKRSLMHEKY